MNQEGVIVAQFQNVDAAERSAQLIPDALVLAARSPEVRARLEQVGLSSSEAEQLARLIDPSSVVVIARVARDRARDDLYQIGQLHGGNLVYAPLGGSTTRSSPNDQSEKASSSTAR